MAFDTTFTIFFIADSSKNCDVVIIEFMRMATDTNFLSIDGIVHGGVFVTGFWIFENAIKSWFVTFGLSSFYVDIMFVRFFDISNCVAKVARYSIAVSFIVFIWLLSLIS